MIMKKRHETFVEIILNYPEKHNAITLEMAQQLETVLSEIDVNQTKFLAIKGAGDKAFCSGGDLTAFHSELSPDQAYEKLMVMNRVLQKIAFFKVPTIALLNGHAFGGGCELATACDFRFAYPDKKFGFIQSNLGILPGWGGDALLYERISPHQAYHWMVTGHKYSSEYLLKMGWVTELVDPHAAYHDIFASYLNKSVTQMQALKRAYLRKLSPILADEIKAGSKECAKLWASETHQAALKEFFGK